MKDNKNVKTALMGAVVTAAAVATGIALSNKKNRDKVKKFANKLKTKGAELPGEAKKAQKKLNKVVKAAISVNKKTSK